MKRASSQPVIRSCGESYGEKKFSSRAQALKCRSKDSRNSKGDIAEQVGRMTIRKPERCKQCEEFRCERHGTWTPQNKANTARHEKRLGATWDMKDLIEGQPNSCQAHYNKSLTPTRLKDVAQLLIPKRTPSPELAALIWFGDWRPSAILDFLRSLSSSLSDSSGVNKVLPQLLKEIHIEEAIIDEEMAEVQANCIRHLPFGSMSKKKQDSCRPALDLIQAEFEKIHRVIIKAQNLRIKALEMVAQIVLNDADAEEFLVAFSGMQDLIHQISKENRVQKRSVPQPFKPLGYFWSLKNGDGQKN